MNCDKTKRHFGTIVLLLIITILWTYHQSEKKFVDLIYNYYNSALIALMTALFMSYVVESECI